MRLVPGLLVAAILVGGSGIGIASPDDLEIWRAFLGALRSGGMDDPARYRPLHPGLRDPLIGFLAEIRSTAVWTETDPPPEVFRVGSRRHYILPVAFRRGESTSTATLCFTLVLEGGEWYFEHLEGIVLRLDKLGDPPISSFPDLTEDEKAWIRDEIQVSKDVRLFAELLRERGKSAAFDWFKDGGGYALQARTWIPFVPPERAFILYAGWDLANLRGEGAVLEAMSDEAARIRFTPRIFALHARTAHLKSWISAEDLRRLFETVWLDRARAAGWDLRIAYEGDACVLHFARRPERAAGDEAKR